MDSDIVTSSCRLRLGSLLVDGRTLKREYVAGKVAILRPLLFTRTFDIEYEQPSDPRARYVYVLYDLT